MKKFLSIALALAMTLSLAVVGASATEYKDLTDKASIKHTEAVTVMNKIGIISGYSDGSFKPAASITRGAAAKIICMAKLGTTTANSLSTEAAPFKDVSTANTFAAFIAYCSNTKIVNGYNDGSFRPSESVTGYAFAKMLLTAIGVTGTYTGTGWEINVATAAQDIGLFDSIDSTVVMSKALSRDNACQMALNAMKYSATGATVYRVIVTKKTASGTADTPYDFNTYSEAATFLALMQGQVKGSPSTGEVASVAGVTKTTGAAGDTLLAKNFSVDASTAADKFGRPSNIYAKSSWASDLVFPAAADYTLTGKVTEAAMYAKVGVTPSTKYTWSAMVDGKAVTVAAPSKTGTGAYANTGIGSQVEVFVNSSAKTVKVVVTTTYVGTIAKITAKTDTTARTVTLANGKTFETESFAKNDVVLYTMANDAIQTMQTAQVVTGKLEKVVTSSGVSTYTVAGKDYVVNQNGSTAITTSSLNKDVSFYVDTLGNIMKDKDATDAAATYIYILANAAPKAVGNYLNNSTGYTCEVYGVTSDGKYGTYNISAAAANTYAVNDDTLIGKAFVYTVDSTGLLTLDATATATNVKTSTAAIKVNDSTATVSSATPILNSATQFIFVSTKSSTDKTVSAVTVKTGVANIGSTIASGKAIVCTEKGVAPIVFVVGTYADSAATGKLAYVDIGTQKTTTVTTTTGASTTTYSYTAYTGDGKTVTLTSSTAVTPSGLYTYNTDMSIGEKQTTVEGTIKAINASAVTVTVSGTDKVLNVTDKTAKIFLGDDTELKIGQAVSYIANATYAGNFDAIVVTADQSTTSTYGLTTTAVDATYTITSAPAAAAKFVNGVANTVKLTADQVAAGQIVAGTYTLTYTVDGGASQTATCTLSAAADTMTFTISVTPAVAATTVAVVVTSIVKA